MENPRRLRLPKPPPPSRASTSFSSHLSSAFNSVKARRSSGSLQRTPSAPALPGSSHSARSADSSQRFQSFSHRHQPFTSSSSTSLDRSATKGSSPLLQQQGYYTSLLAESPIEFHAQEQHIQAGHTQHGAKSPTTIAPPTVMESSKNSARQSTLRRAPPPPLNYPPSEHGSSTSTASGTPLLRQSMSFSTADKGFPGNMSPGRLPEEHNLLKSSNSVRKKTGFSNFMNNMLGSPKRVEISSPSNPVHVTHVGFNFVTGEFTVRFNRCFGDGTRLMGTKYIGIAQGMAKATPGKWHYAN